MTWPPDDLCPRPDRLAPQPTQPASLPIYLTSVWECVSPAQADQLLGQAQAGYVYQRDAHPNADLLAEKCRLLHAADRAVITSSGMAALAAAALAFLQAGDHVVLSSRLYGRTAQLLGRELERLGIPHTVVDTCDLPATAAALQERTRLVVVETIANPTLEVADIAALAALAHRRAARLLVDNTFASPIICRPLELGADLVMESISKMINGHSDVMLGLLAGRAADWERVPSVVATWGLASAPFECWLAARGLASLHLRIQRAGSNALAASRFLAAQPQVAQVQYPGLSSHRHHELAARQFHGGFGTIVAFELRGPPDAATQFIQAAEHLPFCPSLGEISTTVSHPATTSHRSLTAEARAALGITPQTLRLSVGCESPEFVIAALAQGLAAI